MGLFGFFGKKSSSPAVRQRIAELITQLDSSDTQMRFQACQELRDLAPHAGDATDKLLELINDPDGDVCNMASQAVTEIQAAQG